MDRCVGSFNTLNDLSNKACFRNKTEDLNLTMIAGKNESKILTTDISCKCKCKFDGRKCNLNKNWRNNKCCRKCKKHHIYGKDDIWNPATLSCENRKYLALLNIIT